MRALHLAPRAVLFFGLIGCSVEDSLSRGTTSQAVTGEGATVASDKGDYAPGEIALISGAGWEPGEDVALTIDCTCGCHDEMAAVADEAGTFADIGYPITPEHGGATCTVVASSAS